MHTTHAGSNRRQSERTFIQLAQTFPCFGAHFYAVYKFKPPKHKERDSLINDIQNIQLIAIMPHGIGICRNATLLKADVAYEWPFIRTLQYDSKRFLIVLCLTHKDPLLTYEEIHQRAQRNGNAVRDQVIHVA